MKRIKVNGVSIKVFEQRELKEKLRLTDEEIKLVMKYQKTFPELLQNDSNEFTIDARILWNQLNQPQGYFADFAKRDIVNNVYKEKGKNTDEKKYKENIDYVVDYTFPTNFDERNFANVDFTNKNQLSRYGISIEYKLTVNCAKKIALQQGNKIGDIIQDYFLLMERTLRSYEKWMDIREPQKKGNNELKDTLNEDYKASHNGVDAHMFIFTNENDMLNQSLLGYKAGQIRDLLQYKDKITREHFTSDINRVLSELQLIDNSLILSDIPFQQRKLIISKTCENKYSGIKKEFDEFVKRIYSDVI